MGKFMVPVCFEGRRPIASPTSDATVAPKWVTTNSHALLANARRTDGQGMKMPPGETVKGPSTLPQNSALPHEQRQP